MLTLICQIDTITKRQLLSVYCDVLRDLDF